MPIFASFAASGLASKLLHSLGEKLASLFVAKQYSSSIYGSTDGSTWVESSITHDLSGSSDYDADWAYGNGVLISVGSVGGSYYSISLDGGQTWDYISHPDGTPSLYNVSFVDGYFYIVGSGNSNIYRSSNGIGWTTISTPIATGSYAASPVLKLGSTLWNPVSGSPFLRSSTNGTTWTVSGTVSGDYAPVSVSGFIFINGSFRLMNGSALGTIYSSTNLTTWTTSSLPATISSLGSFTAVNGRAYVFPYQPGAISDPVYTSVNGTTWAAASISAASGWSSYTVETNLAYGNSRWMYVGQSMDANASPPTKNALYSTNGTSFTVGGRLDNFNWGNDPSGQPIYGQVNMNNLTYGTKFLLSGYYYSSGGMRDYSCTLSSTDGVTWNTFTTLSTSANTYSGIKYANSLYVGWAGPYASDQTKAIAYSSSAGAVGTWSYAANPYGTFGGGPISFSVVNNLFILSGNTNSSESNTIYTSTNATTWTMRTISLTGYWNHWAHDGSKYVAAKNGSKEFTKSTDLVTWSGTTYSGTTIPVANVWGGSQSSSTVVFNGGYSGGTIASTNGTTWATSSPYPQLEKSSYGNGIFVGTDGYYVITSTDGITWGYTAYLGGNGGNNITFAGGLFITSPNYNGNLSVSTNGTTWTLQTVGSGAAGPVMSTTI